MRINRFFRFSALFFFSLVFGSFLLAQPLPLNIPPHRIPALREQRDNVLQSVLEEQLNANPAWAKLIAERRMAVGLVDMRNPTNARFASVNGEHMMYAASLPKIAVLLAATEAIERGELSETAAVRNDMWLMINKSNNAATTRMIDRVGFEKIAEVMRDPRYLLYDPQHGGGLWVGKRYAAGGKRNPDPMKGISHAATADQVCRYYYLLATGQLVSRSRSEQMLQYMGNPGLHHKFVNTLDRIAPAAQVYRKSGSWSVYHADSVLVWGPQRRYILVALVEDGSGEAICRQLVSSMEQVLGKSRLLAEGY
jgi:beta-lactamase class A